MPIQTLAGNPISSTYQKVVQTDGTYLADGTGSILQTLNVTASYASNAFPYTGSAEITGSLYVIGPFSASSTVITGDVIVQGTASINTLVVNQTQLSTGSNQLGDAGNDFQTLYGTVRIPTGSLTVTGSLLQLGSSARLGNLVVDSYTSSASSTISINSNYAGIPTAGAITLTAFNDSVIDFRRGSGYIQYSGNGVWRFNSTQQWNVGTTFGFVPSVITTLPSARVGIVGTGTTSATTALLVQNSNASSSLVVLDNGYVGINTGSASAYLDISATGNTAGFRITHTDNNFVTFTRGASNIYFGANSGIWQFTTVLPSTLGSASPILGISGKTIGINQNPSAGFTLAISGSQLIQTGSLAIGTTSTGSALTVYKSGSTVMSIQGSQGELFSITDSLSGSLFSVSNISGLPILEVFSDNTVLLGDYLDPMLITTKKVTANSGSTLIYNLPTASYDGAFFDYTIKSGSNARAGQLFGTYVSTTASYTDNSTTDIGDTSGFTFGFFISGSNMVLTGSALTSGWTVRTIIRSI